MNDTPDPAAPVTRGFVGRERPADPGRLPPGQYDVGENWPVLSAEVVPTVHTEEFTLAVDGAVESPQSWDWEGLRALPHDGYSGDIHCVTTWSKFDMTFTGVSLDVLLGAAVPTGDAAYLIVHSSSGYTTNLPLADVLGGKAWVVWEAQGKELTAEHGGPVRLLVPHLYFWKSAKWVNRLEVSSVDRPGFWENNGYHDRGDPWLEQRYVGDP
ncbi:molybdopterin-dependent oxidoreductase [Aeromicrobium sp. CF3.5]|uniref:molybdopterin-dependent oxidoreductase n=1 Tax=Aeromicrobium sp. CF3.5 TaxID=3373078 RepID=UPI003EE7863B